MSAKHTPGPWVHHQEDNFITTRDGRGLLEWRARSLHVTPEERDANARLIAAAPDLLEALETLANRNVTYWNSEGEAKSNFGSHQKAIDAFAKARAAIAKATT